MTETPDRPGEHGHHGDDRTTGNSSAPEASVPSSPAPPHQSPPASEPPAAAAPDTAAPETAEMAAAVVDPPTASEAPEPAITQPRWLAREEPPAHGKSRRDRALFDLLPVGVLIYRLDRLLYANRVFLDRMGFASLQALEEAGGLDALYVEPGVSSAPSTSESGTPVTISASQDASGHAASVATDARLFTISWDDESALALICSNAAVAESPPAAIPRRGSRIVSLA